MDGNRREFDGVFLEKLDNIVAQNKAQSKLIEKLDKTIHNSGNGLVVRVTRSEEKIKSLCGTVKIHWAFIIAIVLTVLGVLAGTVL